MHVIIGGRRTGSFLAQQFYLREEPVEIAPCVILGGERAGAAVTLFVDEIFHVGVTASGFSSAKERANSL